MQHAGYLLFSFKNGALKFIEMMLNHANILRIEPSARSKPQLLMWLSSVVAWLGHDHRHAFWAAKCNSCAALTLRM